MLFSMLMTSACGVTTKLENSQRLIARPDFSAAVIAAPEWVRSALKTITELEERAEANE
jgi:hypothetical protein